MCINQATKPKENRHSDFHFQYRKHKIAGLNKFSVKQPKVDGEIGQPIKLENGLKAEIACQLKHCTFVYVYIEDYENWLSMKCNDKGLNSERTN